MVDSLNLKGEDTIVLGDLALFMQQSKLLIVFIYACSDFNTTIYFFIDSY